MNKYRTHNCLELTEKEYEKRIGKVKQTSIKFSDIK